MKLKLTLLFLMIFFLAYPREARAAVQTPKKGVGGQYGAGIEAVDATYPLFQQLGVSWFYNWAATIIGFKIQEKSCVEFVPTLRYKKSDDDRKSDIEPLINKGYKGIYWLIGNEPDSAASDDSDGKRASQEELIRAYTSYAKIIKDGDPTAKLIFGGFLSATEFTDPAKYPVGANFARLLKDSLVNSGIKPDGWHIHQYNCCDVNNLKTTLKNWKSWQSKNLLGGETWITEFSSLRAQPNLDKFMKDTANFLESTTDPNYKVDRYAWFTLSSSYFSFDSLIFNGELNSLGLTYANLPEVGPRPTPKPCSYTPAPSPTLVPSSSPSAATLSLQKGWNKIRWAEGYNSQSLTNCTEGRFKSYNFWVPAKNYQAGSSYYLRCF